MPKKKSKKRPKRGCGKHGWRKGGNANWKCKPGVKKHAYTKKSKKAKNKKSKGKHPKKRGKKR